MAWIRKTVTLQLLLLAVAVAAQGCGDDASGVAFGPPARMIVVSGNNQSGSVGAKLAGPLSVKLLDARGVPVPGQMVNWTVLSGRGNLVALSDETDGEGVVRAEWTLGSRAGEQRAEAKLAGVPSVYFTCVALPGPPAAMVVVAGATQTGTQGARVLEDLVVEVRDGFGNLTIGVPVSFEVSAGNGWLTQPATMTDLRGQAHTGWFLGEELDVSNGVQARVEDLRADFSAMATRGVYPTATWQPVDQPASVGWSAEWLDEVRATLGALATTGFVAVVAGRVVLEYGDTERLSYLASVRKSVLAMLFGVWVDRGEIRLDKTLAELGIDDIQGLTDAERQANIEHLLTARSGVYHPASNAGDDLAHAPPRGSQEPGSYFLYSNWDFNALGTIFEQETGTNIYDALAQELAAPLSMENWDRSVQRKGGDLSISMHPAYHMYLSTRDMARLGYLMLRRGRWADVQLISSAWMDASVQPITRRSEMNPPSRRDGNFGYGYLWWVFDNPDLDDNYDGAYVGLGAYGQHILVVPMLDLVIAHKTVPADGRVTHAQFLEVAEQVMLARCTYGVC